VIKEKALLHLVLAESRRLAERGAPELNARLGELCDTMETSLDRKTREYVVSATVGGRAVSVRIPETGFEFYRRADGGPLLVAGEVTTSDPGQDVAARNVEAARRLLREVLAGAGIAIPPTLASGAARLPRGRRWIWPVSIAAAAGIAAAAPAVALAVLAVQALLMTARTPDRLANAVGLGLGVICWFGGATGSAMGVTSAALAHLWLLWEAERRRGSTPWFLGLGVAGAALVLLNRSVGVAHVFIAGLAALLSPALSSRPLDAWRLVGFATGMLGATALALVAAPAPVVADGPAAGLTGGAVFGAVALGLGFVYWFTGRHDSVFGLLLPFYSAAMLFLSELAPEGVAVEPYGALIVGLGLSWVSKFPSTRLRFLVHG
jgi:hypothetical protein